MENLRDIAASVRNYMGLLRKKPIAEVVELLQSTHIYGKQLPSYGDDAAVIPWQDGYLLMASDGMMMGLLINEPYAAGKASVMVTVNDIYSMGGRPIALVNVLASGDPEQRREIVKGIEKGCQKLQVPMVGGHLHPDAPVDSPALSVAILGFAKQLLRSSLAMPGDELIMAVDLTGQMGCHSVTSWDANSGKSSEQLLYRLEALPKIAESKLAVAAKDISNAGVIGTMAIMIENSGCGAVINLEAIPKPEIISFSRWLHCFQSFGFVLAAPPENTLKICQIFKKRGITACRVGHVHAEPIIYLKTQRETVQLFDFRNEIITGIRRPNPVAEAMASRA